jgi:hypothetical protein
VGFFPPQLGQNMPAFIRPQTQSQSPVGALGTVTFFVPQLVQNNPVFVFPQEHSQVPASSANWG